MGTTYSPTYQIHHLLGQHSPPLTLERTPADGDCLIHALRFRLFSSNCRYFTRDPSPPDQIRRSVADYVKGYHKHNSSVKIALAGRDIKTWYADVDERFH